MKANVKCAMSTARNGNVELAFDVVGSGPDLLLVGGTASTRPLWDLVRARLARSFRTIALENRDSGESSIASAPYGLLDLAADAAAVLDAAGAGRAHVVGRSLGGAIAQELALSFPQRRASPAHVCTWARGDRDAGNAMTLPCALTNSVGDDRTLVARPDAFVEATMGFLEQ